MIRVRFASGLVVQYNDAHTAYCATDTRPYHELWTTSKEKGGHLVVIAPRESVIEWYSPCRVYSSQHEPEELGRAFLEAITNEQRRGQFGVDTLKRIKTALEAFNRHTFRWKE